MALLLPPTINMPALPSKIDNFYEKSNDNVDVYRLDDLLVAVSRDLIKYGMEASNIPDSIKEWVAGKVLKSLPKRLVQKLLSFILDNRDITDCIGLKETPSGDEITITIYKSLKAKQKSIHSQKQPQNYTTPLSNQIFTDTHLTKTGSKFYSDDFIIDSNQIIPAQVSNINKNLFYTESENSLTDVNSEYNDNEDKKRQKETKKKKVLLNCPKCDKKFDMRSKYNSHLKNNHAEYYEETKPLTQSQKRLKSMSEIETDPSGAFHTCLICNKQFQSSAHIVRHVDCVHRNVKTASCPICQKSFTRKKNFIDHMMAHSGIKPFMCDYCGRTFRRSDKLDDHKRRIHPANWQIELDRRKFDKEQKRILKIEQNKKNGRKRKVYENDGNIGKIDDGKDCEEYIFKNVSRSNDKFVYRTDVVVSENDNIHNHNLKSNTINYY